MTCLWCLTCLQPQEDWESTCGILCGQHIPWKLLLSIHSCWGPLSACLLPHSSLAGWDVVAGLKYCGGHANKLFKYGEILLWLFWYFHTFYICTNNFNFPLSLRICRISNIGKPTCYICTRNTISFTKTLILFLRRTLIDSFVSSTID